MANVEGIRANETCSKSRHTDNKHCYDDNGVCYFCSDSKPEPVQPPKCPGAFPLTSNDIDGMLLGFEVYSRTLSTQARIEGMKIQNYVREQIGEAPEYHEQDFITEANNMYSYARYLRVLRESGGVKSKEGGP